MEYMIEDSIQD